jgi:hypothetical protein
MALIGRWELSIVPDIDHLGPRCQFGLHFMDSLLPVFSEEGECSPGNVR